MTQFMSFQLFQTGISNAFIATVLAAAVLLLTWKSKWPAWTHIMWVLVLVKLVAPPLFWVSAEVSGITVQNKSSMMAVGETGGATMIDTESVSLDALLATAAIEGPTNSAQRASVSNAKSRATGQIPWLMILSAVWGMGTIAFFVWHTWRLKAFRRWLRRSEVAPDRLVATLASVVDRVGIRSVPEVLIVPGKMAPSVFAIGNRSTLLLPEKLLGQLTDVEIRTVMAHEMVHLRRRDHWVRLLELFTGTLFWWHPGIPFVRRRIHRAADQACDAWVTSLFPKQKRDYASAMLKTIDFLSSSDQPILRKQQSMSLLTGMGDVRSLSTRMRQISRGQTPHSVSWKGRCMIALSALLFLPLGLLAFAPSEVVAQQPPVEAPAKQPARGADPFGGGNDPVPAKQPARDMSDPFSDGADNPFGKPVVRKKIADADPFAGNGKRIPADEWIRSQLGKEHSVTAIDQPLEQFIAILSRNANIPILVDQRALEEVGLAPETPVTIDLANVSLRSILRLSLRDLELTYIIKNEVLQITTLEVAENNLTVKAHALPVELADRSEKVINALTATVVPDMWEQLGGACTVSAIDNVLVVSATEPVHEQVAEFILKVEAAFKSRQKTVPAKR